MEIKCPMVRQAFPDLPEAWCESSAGPCLCIHRLRCSIHLPAVRAPLTQTYRSRSSRSTLQLAQCHFARHVFDRMPQPKNNNTGNAPAQQNLRFVLASSHHRAAPRFSKRRDDTTRSHKHGAEFFLRSAHHLFDRMAARAKKRRTNEKDEENKNEVSGKLACM